MAPLEIHIPDTHTADEGHKPYTIYHIELSLPLRKHQVQKRYSEFTELDTQLRSQLSSPPPAQLPPKSWLRSTIHSPELTETRRQGLEAYLQAILSDADSRWRSSTAWRAFLNLPTQTSISFDSPLSPDGEVSSGAQQQTAILDSADWLQVHREIKSQIHAARSALSRRDRATNVNQQHSLSAEAKAALVRAATGIARCEDSLRKQQGSSGSETGSTTTAAASPGSGEIRRRRDMVTATKKEVESLETVLRSSARGSSSGNALRTPTSTSPVSAGGMGSTATPPAATEAESAALFEGSSTRQMQQKRKTGRVLGGPLKEETDTTRELDNQGVLQLQKQTMAEQDQDVLVLGQAVARMKDMGIMINEELVVQNQMLNMVEGDVDRVQGKIDVAKKRITKIK